MPPISWTSYGRIPRIRLLASRATAKASTRIASSSFWSPVFSLPLSISVCFLSSSSLIASYFGSSAPICWVFLYMRFKTFFCASPKTLCKIRVSKVLSASLSVGFFSFVCFFFGVCGLAWATFCDFASTSAELGLFTIGQISTIILPL